MIQNTFCHLPRVAKGKEQTLWQNGICTWNDFLHAERVPGIGTSKKPWFDRHIQHGQRALLNGESTHFLTLPSTEHWRLWDEYKEEAAFIDIETNHRRNITVLGISDGEQSWQFVRHHNLEKRAVQDVLNKFKLFVTFNGASFDLPIIRNFFGAGMPTMPHIDLRWAAQKAGYTGGLKNVEKQLGIKRPDEVEGITGADALTLWSAYRRTGNTAHRDLLLQYNEEDILNLKPLAQIVYDQLAADMRKHF